LPVRIIHRSTAAGACAALRYWTVDVVILDLSLPDARGLEALHRIRDASPGTPVVVLSGITDQALALEALRAGAQDYVMKPPPEGQVLSRILRFAVERQRLLSTIDAALRSSAIAARQWKLVAEVSKSLAASSDAIMAIPIVAKLCVPEVADCFVVVLTGEANELPAIDFWHAEGERGLELKDAVQSLFAPQPGTAGNGSREHCDAFDTADPEAWDGKLKRLYAPLGLESGTAMALHFGGRVRGALTLGFLSGRRNPVADVEFARSVADRVSSALEQNRLLRQTQRAVGARDRALSIVSHDLRSPISTIKMCAAALLDPVPAPANGIREMGQLIQRSASWMEHIVEDLLDRASLDAGHLALNRCSTSVAELFEAARLMFGAIADECTIDLIINHAADSPLIDADPHRLLQAISNLVSNALKFTPQGGRVQLLANCIEVDPALAFKRDDGSGVRFTVTDTGNGISAEDLTHIFDWYWQSPGAATGGAGLGLAIAKGLIEAHHSHLNVHSVLGAGTTFWFTIAAANGSLVQHAAERELSA
jgi:signal transduction histidine kinase/ActR/RegA family two-component response regulator